jgi:cysteinyl-tRNA synthetase
MRHHRAVRHSSSHPQASTSGVVGAEGRYPVHEQAPVPLTIGGVPLVPVGPLRMYTCGITPYDVTHVGHAATFVWADLVASLAHAVGAEALVSRNVTDVDDVLTRAARGSGWHYDEMALTQEFHFDRDMRALSVAAPAEAPHARAHVDAVIRLGGALLAGGAAYERDGYVYFRGEGLPGRAGLGDDEALAAAREYGDQDGVPGRDSPFDVPVWRPSTEEHPAWPSPWGWGRPGWHAECAAMAVCSLGSSVDVLVGGADLVFPHHAYQAAMVEAATGVTPFARTSVHVGEVRQGGVKMAKSRGNLTLVSDLLARHRPAAVRFALLHRPHDEPWECEESVFETAAAQLARLQELAGDPEAASTPHDGVLGAVVSELDVPGAVAVAHDEGPEAARYLLDLLKVRRA